MSTSDLGRLQYVQESVCKAINNKKCVHDFKLIHRDRVIAAGESDRHYAIVFPRRTRSRNSYTPLKSNTTSSSSNNKNNNTKSNYLKNNSSSA
jgi:hypothetical protein